MSLHARKPDPIPEETARVARAAFPDGTLYLRMREALDVIYSDEDFADLFPTRGQPAEAPWRLALATIFQFAEDLSDREAADAVRGRIDWKYALCLELTDPGFDHSVLSEFRTRLLIGGAERRLLDLLVDCARDRGLLKARGRQRTDSTHVLAAVRALNRVELVTETMRHALTVLAVARTRVAARPRTTRVGRALRAAPRGRRPPEQAGGATCPGGDHRPDGSSSSSPSMPTRHRPGCETSRRSAMLRSVWIQNYLVTEDGRCAGEPTRRGCPGGPVHQLALRPRRPLRQETRHVVGRLQGPPDRDLRGRHPQPDHQRRDDAGPVADGAVTPDIHQDLAERDLLPGLHVVDTGYLDAELLVTTPAQFGVDLLGPTRKDYHWQARDGQGFDAQEFTINWDDEQATCPAGRTSISWTPAVDKRRNHVVKIKFSTKDCGPCPLRAQCTRSRKASARRTITVRPQDQYEALRAAREREQTDAFAEEYARRAGVEGTLSQAVRRCGLRRSRYVGLARTHLGHVLTATAVNFVRIGEWLAGTPRAKTRHPPFATVLAPAAAA